MPDNTLTNKAFLAVTDRATRKEILSSIATHYEITEAEALEEVTSTEAEHLLNYLSGTIRSATSLLMKRHGFSA